MLSPGTRSNLNVSERYTTVNGGILKAHAQNILPVCRSFYTPVILQIILSVGRKASSAKVIEDDSPGFGLRFCFTDLYACVIIEKYLRTPRRTRYQRQARQCDVHVELTVRIQNLF